MQQMGNGVSQMETLCGFLDITCSTSLRSHIERAEKVLGKLQLETTKSSCEEAITEEIKATEEAGDLKTHACSIPGHEHQPLPMLAITFGL